MSASRGLNPPGRRRGRWGKRKPGLAEAAPGVTPESTTLIW